MAHRAIIRQRLRAQRITGTPFASAGDVVRHFTCLQAQDAPLAAWSLGRRSEARTYTRVLEEQRAGAFLRTHILRPTWHYVAPEDLRWIQALIGPRVERSTAGRRRQLGITTTNLDTCFTRLTRLLADGVELTRAELTPRLEDLGDGPRSEVLSHLLLMAEVHCVVVSGRPREAGTVVAGHTYALADRVVPPRPDDRTDGDAAVRRLARRFFAAYGPANERDLARWSSLPLTPVRQAIGELADELERITVDGDDLYFVPDGAIEPPVSAKGVLLPIFDPLVLTYPDQRIPRSGARLDRSRLIAEAGGGVIVVGTRDVGLFKRTVSADRVTITLYAETALSGRTRTAVHRAANALAAFYERPAAVTVVE